MNHVVAALAWEAWHMTRRQVLFVVAIMLTGGFGLLAAIGDRLDRGGGFLVWMFLLALTGILAFFIGTVGVRSGFPFSRSYSRPVSTAILVGVPLIYTASVTSATYVLATALLQSFFDVSFPVLPVTVLIGTLAAVMTACSWATRSSVTRVLAIMTAYLLLSALIRGFGTAGEGFPTSMHADLVRLQPPGYVAAVLILIVAYVLVVIRVSQLRHSGERIRHSPRSAQDSTAPTRFPSIVTLLRYLSTSLVRLRCPTNSPIAAAVWLQLQGRGFPIIAAGAVMSIILPILLASAETGSTPTATVYAVAGLLAPILTAAGASIWNRQSGWSTKLSSFEGARPQSALSAVSVDILVSAISMLAAYALIALGLILTFPAYNNLMAAQFLQEALQAWINTTSFPKIIAGIAVFIAFVVALGAALLVLRLLSALYGKILRITALGVSVYALLVATGIVSGILDERMIAYHFRGVALLTLVSTIIACGAGMRTSELRPSHMAAILLASTGFIAMYAWVVVGPELSSIPRSILALHVAVVLVLPGLLTSAPWLYSRLRQSS